MKVKIGIIGVYDSIEIAKKISTEFGDEANFVFYIYDDVNEILDFINIHQDELDVIMFTGQFPLKFVEKEDVLHKPYLSILKSSTTIVETLWKLRDENIDYSRLSIDRSPKTEVFETLDFLNIPKDNIYIIADSSRMSTNDIYKFHSDLWDQGKISAIITSNYRVYRKLLEHGARAYRILPSRFLTRLSIKKALELVDTEKIKSTQVAVQIVKIKGIDNEITLDYDKLKTITKFDEILIDYTQQNQGSFFKFGNSEYMIFSTRGFLKMDSVQQRFGRLVERSENLKISFSLGIGYGDTVSKSENNARIALSYALKESKNSCYIIEDDCSIVGPICGKNSFNLSYDLISTDKRINEISQNTGVSPKYLSKLKAIINQINNNVFDSEDLAQYLNVTQRSALRILNRLESGGIAKIIGKKNNKTKGRPKNLYEIDLG